MQQVYLIVFLTFVSMQFSCASTKTNKSLTSEQLASNIVYPEWFGAVGDAITDDTIPVQWALTRCSDKGLTCHLSKEKKYLITSPIYLWGKAKLKGDSGTFLFKEPQSPYLFNIGISGQNKLEEAFSGEISDVAFKVIGGSSGRVIFLWRTSGAKLANNIFDMGDSRYGPISSGNDNDWVKNGFKNCIRKNILIQNNKIFANGKNQGSEGIGLGHFTGAIIKNNEVLGVGDDPIGIHFSDNIKILNNNLESVDGRIYVSNSKNVDIYHNKHTRIPSMKDGRYYKGISLIYIGFEAHGTNKYAAPTNTIIHDNVLYYPLGAIDHGAAIYLYAPRNARVTNNQIINESPFVTASAIHLLPLHFSGLWNDPSNLDNRNSASVWDARIEDNISKGRYPLSIIMTGNCVDYKGKVHFYRNKAKEFKLYCKHVVSFENNYHSEQR